MESKTFEPIVSLPGFARGLAIYGKYAYVGLSFLRPKSLKNLEFSRKLEENGNKVW
jgi:hypothetical protein